MSYTSTLLILFPSDFTAIVVPFLYNTKEVAADEKLEAERAEFVKRILNLSSNVPSEVEKE